MLALAEMCRQAMIDADEQAFPLVPLDRATFDGWLASQSSILRTWVKAAGFTAHPQSTLLLADGATVLLGVEHDEGPWTFGSAPRVLPARSYRIVTQLSATAATNAALGWMLGSYRFDRYKPAKSALAKLCWPSGADGATALRAARAITLARDLINTPAQDLGPLELAAAAQEVARAHDADVRISVGDELLHIGYRTVHAVGQGSPRAARLIDIRWGEASRPLVTLIGKGVCFDSGGLDLKTADGMRLMKKDMGGAAHVLALAHMIMDANLPVRLRVLIPAVDNAISGSALRPGDIVRTRSGKTVEIGNTDAEGRLILCDALADASSEHPDLLIDIATLTSAARVALGPDVPALFCNDDEIAASLAAVAKASGDPLWRLPLWAPYLKDLESQAADLNNVSHNPFAGAIYAALFLQSFVAPTVRWVHLDVYGWNVTDRPGRPEGGEAQGLRALFHFLRERYASSIG